jgi:hypothetical protein
MYIIAAPSKSATTSFFKLLTDNCKFPVIQTHDLYTLNIHDAIDGEFTKYINNHYPDLIKNVKFIDENIEWNGHFQSYQLILQTPEISDDILNYINNYNPKILVCLRDPYTRSVSAFLHWCQFKQLCNEMKINEIITKDPLSFILEKVDNNMFEKMNFQLMKNMILRIKDKKQLLDIDDLSELYESYFFKSGMLLREYTHLNYMLKKNFNYKWGKSSQNIKTIWMDQIPNDIFSFFELPLNLSIPHERDKFKKEINYIFSPEISYVYEYLCDVSHYIEVNDDDKKLLRLCSPIK